MENAHYFLHVTDTHLCFDAEAPDTCCTEQALRSLYQTAFACGIKILLHSEWNICGNVQLTGTNVPAFALLRAVKGCHPRIPSAGIVHLFGVLFCLRKGSYAIFH